MVSPTWRVSELRENYITHFAYQRQPWLSPRRAALNSAILSHVLNTFDLLQLA
jgi:hypothetical protein